MDTANDFRIKFAEKGLSELEKIVQNLKVQKRKEILGRIRIMSSLLQTVKYSYVRSEELEELDEFKKLVNEAKSVRKLIKSSENDFNAIQANYWLEYIEKLPELMKRGEIDNPCLAIRFFAGEIVNRGEVEKNKLWFCVVDCGFRIIVVTNSPEFLPGKTAVLAYLPPRRFKNFISRGMFVCVSNKDKGELDVEDIKKYCSGDVEAAILSFM
ncbi:MAG: RNA-binding protein [Archaeoglobus sp.]|nr:MAG: RNA-binding protein [Archaeoglobus sp.]